MSEMDGLLEAGIAQVLVHRAGRSMGGMGGLVI